ncbi:hypothetical protein [Actinoplanes auranticolor]|uniref:Uncharacterized protein n=1 Tax=Actinoplanes auranticolor TaxID=47988 RepID=A0A919S6R2_9ACTN|nr:hypothetical protein [Actinoplanes auranticolor]GIM65944.1 hypothetical protein Aau02nite_20840 [Actinoplanes auranticolor]
MASLVGVSRCSPLRTIADSSRVWLLVHLSLYFVLDLATLAALNAPEVSPDLDLASKVLVAGVHAFIAVCWAAPLHGAALLLAAGALALLRSCAGLRWYWFRLAALAVFVMPALLLSLLLSAGNLAASLAVLPMHVLMGLVVVQPRWPNAVESLGTS